MNSTSNLTHIPKTTAKIDGKRTTTLAPAASKPQQQSFRAFFLEKNRNKNNDIIRSVLKSNVVKKNQHRWMPVCLIWWINRVHAEEWYPLHCLFSQYTILNWWWMMYEDEVGACYRPLFPQVNIIWSANLYSLKSSFPSAINDITNFIQYPYLILSPGTS